MQTNTTWAGGTRLLAGRKGASKDSAPEYQNPRGKMAWQQSAKEGKAATGKLRDVYVSVACGIE